ncbi:FK506-binding protein 6 [Acropora cervicornis]|uniref:FK506-binding protein 6 n=1 Tax=Acropora cervicornis TaxID=6130 RepID=A0AAD9VH71_ACRCE|nr:FK506-binding protein 6 [Acropora cervicornis]
MDAPEVIENLQDLTLTSREGFVPSRYTVPLREGIDFNDLVQGDGTMFETDLANMAYGSKHGGPYWRWRSSEEDFKAGHRSSCTTRSNYHSNGYIEFNDEPFDSSRLRNRPYVTKLVLYEVELLSYIDHQAADDYDTFTEAGNDFYKRKQVPRALKKYIKAIKILEDCHLQNQDQERLLNEVLLKIYLNAAHCSLELAQSARAVKYARKALSIDPRNADQNSTAFSLLSTLTKQEKDFIKTAAKDLGLRVELNEGTCKELKVFKE